MSAGTQPFVPADQTSPAVVRDVIARLIDVCRDGEDAFNLAAHAVTADPMLRAELAQYSGQRREFVLDLHDAIHDFIDGDEATESHFEDPADRLAGLREAANHGDRLGILRECERHDTAALDAYRHALTARLPYSVGSVVYSQFMAISRVQNRLQSLADHAGGASPMA